LLVGAAVLAIASALPFTTAAADEDPAGAQAVDAGLLPSSELELEPPRERRGFLDFFRRAEAENAESAASLEAQPAAKAAPAAGPPLPLVPKQRQRRSRAAAWKGEPPNLPRPRPEMALAAAEDPIILQTVEPVAALPAVQLMPVPAVLATATAASTVVADATAVAEVEAGSSKREAPHAKVAVPDPKDAPLSRPQARAARQIENRPGRGSGASVSDEVVKASMRQAAPRAEPQAGPSDDFEREPSAQAAPAPVKTVQLADFAVPGEIAYPPAPTRSAVAAAEPAPESSPASVPSRPAAPIVAAALGAAQRIAGPGGWSALKPAPKATPRKRAVPRLAETWPDPFGGRDEWRQAPLAEIAASAPTPMEPSSVGSINALPPLDDDALAKAPPYELVRTLQALQDRIALGSTEAFAAQRGLLARIDAQFTAADPGVWQDQRNARAIVTYVLSGGSPAVLRTLIAAGPLPHVDERLVRGALAYLDGNATEAGELLAEIDARSLPASMGSQVALAQSALVVGDDPKKADALLDLARLLSPGTLAEEAALRRQIFVVDQLGDIDKFETLSRQYLERFRHSVYAGNFRQRFAAALTRMEFMDDPAQFGRLDDMLSELDADSRRDLYLTVARAAVTLGKVNAATVAAERAAALAPADGVDAARASLYRAAVTVVTPGGLKNASADLRAIDPDDLPAADRELREAALATAESIHAAADFPAIAARLSPATAADEEALAAVPAIARAREALQVAGALLEDKP
jgi:chemotaxis protein MotC